MNNRVADFDFMIFANAVCECVSEDDLKKLKGYIFTDDFDSCTRLIAYYAIKTLLFTRKRTDTNFSAEAFYSFISEVLAMYPKLDTFQNHRLLSTIFNDRFDANSTQMYSEMKALLIKLIIEDDKGYNCSCFKDYFKWLYQMDPTISYAIQEIKNTFSTIKQMDDNVFKCLDLHSVGQHIFYKAVAATKSANIDIVKLAVKQMHSYPFNNRPEQVDDDDYYSKICINVGIHQLPKAVFDRAKELHNDIFGVGFLELSSLITTRKNTIESNQQSFEEQRSKIISDNNHKGKKIDFDISPNIDKLDEIDITLKRCVAELELLTFYEEQIKNTKSTFCENYDDTTVVDRKLKELSFRYLSSTESL